MAKYDAKDHDAELSLPTLLIHGGQAPEPVTGAVMPPVFQSSTYAQKGPGEHTGFEYIRTNNPTRYAMERLIARVDLKAERKAGRLVVRACHHEDAKPGNASRKAVRVAVERHARAVGLETIDWNGASVS